jgi:AcrR family transcriptional regulator
LTKTVLTPKDWIMAGLGALAEGGIDAVRVEALSRRLKTSKGSFYWHFADRPALLAAMLDLWEAEGTAEVIDAVEDERQPADRLRRVARLALAPVEQGLDTARTEAALRAWAAEDAAVGNRIAKVDRRRRDYLSGLLGEIGHDRATAARLAGGLYLTLMGLYSTRRYAPDMAGDENLMVLIEQAIAGAPKS